jgi:histidinol-phosphate/aromatic aminotransferase/cobyric acid decarboxylase-like protein
MANILIAKFKIENRYSFSQWFCIDMQELLQTLALYRDQHAPQNGQAYNKIPGKNDSYEM